MDKPHRQVHLVAQMVSDQATTSNIEYLIPSSIELLAAFIKLVRTIEEIEL